MEAPALLHHVQGHLVHKPGREDLAANFCGFHADRSVACQFLALPMAAVTSLTTW